MTTRKRKEADLLPPGRPEDEATVPTARCVRCDEVTSEFVSLDGQPACGTCAATA